MREARGRGWLNVVNVEGGTLACEAAGLPVVRGKKAISLERQVRIAAGFLVLVGAVLALTVHPYFAGLSAFVGAGLMFAGITDTCGMGMLLARMPWNQVSTEPTGASVQNVTPRRTRAASHSRNAISISLDRKELLPCNSNNTISAVCRTLRT